MHAVADSQKSFRAPDSLTTRANDVEQMRQILLANEPSGYAESARATAVRDWTSRLPEIRCPVIYIGGALDPSAPVEPSCFEPACQTLRSMLDGVSHLLPPEAPSIVNDLILRFLDRFVLAAEAAPDSSLR